MNRPFEDQNFFTSWKTDFQRLRSNKLTNENNFTCVVSCRSHRTVLIKHDSHKKLVCVYGNLKKKKKSFLRGNAFCQVSIYIYMIYLYLESVWKLEVDQIAIPKREKRDYSSWSRKRLLKIIGNPFRSGIPPPGGLTDRGNERCFNGFGKKKKKEEKKEKIIPFINLFNGWNKRKFENQNCLFFFIIIETFLSLIHRYCIKYSIICKNIPFIDLFFFFFYGMVVETLRKSRN